MHRKTTAHSYRLRRAPSYGRSSLCLCPIIAVLDSRGRQYPALRFATRAAQGGVRVFSGAAGLRRQRRFLEQLRQHPV
jgi:hypothetical protein